MKNILFIAHTKEDQSLPKAALEALTAARELAASLDAELHAGIIGQEAAKAAEALGGCGAAKVMAVTGSDFAQPRYASDAAAVEALCRASGAEVVIAPATSRMSRILPGVAARMDGRVDTHLTGIFAKDGQPHVNRWYYRQRMVADQTRTGLPWFMTLEPGCFEPFQGQGSVEFEQVQAELPALRTTVTGLESPSADEQTIRPDAELLLVAGAGWTKKQADGQAHVQDAESIIHDFLGSTKSSLGSSKSLVDQGGDGQAVISFLTHLHQVGQTGATPRHQKGLATCCHGEEPHVVGWRFINERRAVNLDASCGWAQGKADVLYVADAFEVMKKINALLG